MSSNYNISWNIVKFSALYFYLALIFIPFLIFFFYFASFYTYFPHSPGWSSYLLSMFFFPDILQDTEDFGGERNMLLHSKSSETFKERGMAPDTYVYLLCVRI